MSNQPPAPDCTRLPDGTCSVETGMGTTLFVAPEPAAPLVARAAGALLSPERLAEIKKQIPEISGILVAGLGLGLAKPLCEVLPALFDHAAALTTEQQRREEAEAAFANAKWLMVRAAQRAEKAEAELAAAHAAIPADHRPGRPLTERVLYLATFAAMGQQAKTELVALRKEHQKLQDRLVEEQEANEKLKTQHKGEVLDILRDMRLPILTTESGNEMEMGTVLGQNLERKAINDYCNQKAYEYSPQGIGPDPTKDGEWDTLPKSDAAAAPVQGEGEGGGDA